MIKSSSLFTQVLSLINRNKFARDVHFLQAERQAKGFRCWEQLVAMLFAQLGGANSLREICGGLATSAGKLSHLGVTRLPNKSTLAYANEHRPWQLYEKTFYHLFEQAAALAGQKKRRFRFKNPLRSLDSSTIDLCLSMYDWAKFRRTKGAVKLHLMLDHRGCLPCWARITNGKVHDVKPARSIQFEAETVLAVDRGYIDYELFDSWTKQRVWFVTRTKNNMAYRIVESRDVPTRGPVLRDEVIELIGQSSSEKCPHLLRRVEIWDDSKKCELAFLTNNMKFAASTVAAIYKERWQIELFFKALKQNLKIKSFVGTSENAVKIQIWTAVICMLLLKILKLRASFDWSLSNLAAMLRMNLLTYRDLWCWLDKPYQTAVIVPPWQQPLLFD